MSRRSERLTLKENLDETAYSDTEESILEVFDVEKKKNQGEITSREVKQRFINLIKDSEIEGDNKVYLETMIEKAELLRGATKVFETADSQLDSENMVLLLSSSFFALYSLFCLIELKNQTPDVQRALADFYILLIGVCLIISIRYYKVTKEPRKTKNKTEHEIAKTSDEMMRIIDLLYGLTPDERTFEYGMLSEVRSLLEKENFNRKVQDRPHYVYDWNQYNFYSRTISMK